MVYSFDWGVAGANGSYSATDGALSLGLNVTTATASNGDTAFIGAAANDSGLMVSGITEPVITTITFAKPVTNLSFWVLDIDASANMWDDRITIIATNALGQQVPITWGELSGLHSTTGNQLDADGNASNGVEGIGAQDSVQVSIAGPISSISFVFDNGESYATSGMFGVSDLTFDGPDGIVEGTAGDDLIQVGYTNDPDYDLIDNNDGMGVGGTTGNADYIMAGDGNDSVLAGLGNDVIYAGSGNDTVLGGAGDDWASLGDGNDVFGTYDTDSAGNDTVYGEAGDDYLIGGDQNDILYGGVGNDTLSGGVGSDTVYGGDGDDQFYLSDDHETETIVGGENAGDNDVLNFGNYLTTSEVTVNFTGDEAGVYFYDTIPSGYAQSQGSFTEIEAISGTEYGDTINGALATTAIAAAGFGGNDSMTGGSGDDLFDGGTGNDTLTGGAGNDVLCGSDDADVIYGGAGDTVFGGEGGSDNDMLVLNYADVQSITYGGGTGESGTVSFYGGGTLSFTEIEHVTFAGPVDGSGDDDYIGQGYVDLNGDQVDGSDGVNDTILGYGGNDTINAGVGNDLIFGGDGDDSLLGMDGADQTWGDAGNDFIDATAYDGADDLAYGGTGNDTLVSRYDLNGGNDVLYGGDDRDVLIAGAGDSVFGGEGGDDFDRLDLSGAPVVGTTGIIFTASGAGTVQNSGAALSFAEIEAISGTAGADSVDAAADSGGMVFDLGGGNDSLYAGGGHDQIDGGSGYDLLYGEAGNDTLSGGAGNDSLYGGDDRDTFLAGPGDLVDGGEGGDDFDILDLTAWGHPATNILYEAANPENGTVEFLDSAGNVVGTMTFANIESVVACFTPGAQILTALGEMPVEYLRRGDLVLTRDNGYRPIRWLGRRDLTYEELLAEPRFCPVCIAKGALGDGLPERDMMVSPQHRLLVSGPWAELLFGEHEILVAAKHLVGKPGVEQRMTQGVSYIHLLFDSHEILRADGAWSESFQPGVQTMAGMNSAQRREVLALFPELAQGAPQAFPSARSTLGAREARLLWAA